MLDCHNFLQCIALSVFFHLNYVCKQEIEIQIFINNNAVSSTQPDLKCKVKENMQFSRFKNLVHGKSERERGFMIILDADFIVVA